MIWPALRAVVFGLFCMTALPAFSENLRFAAFNAELTRRNPGLLVGDLMKGGDPQVERVVEIIQRVQPDVLLLSGMDYDAQGIALGLLLDSLKIGRGDVAGIDYSFWFIAPVNTGVPSGLDLDGDGRLARANDAWGFGFFEGQEGMAILSRYPVALVESRTFQNYRWVDLPGAVLPVWPDGTPWPDARVQATMRLSTVSHWDIVVKAPEGPVHLLAANPTPPVFDGPEDANGRRNHDEIEFWVQYLDGAEFGDDQGRTAGLGEGAVVVLGDFNADPLDGDGMHDGIAALLGHDRLTDPMPKRPAGGSLVQDGVNVGQMGDPMLDTADWEDVEGQPGNMRVDFVLPSSDFRIEDAGVFWPAPDDPLHRLVESSEEFGGRHRLVWVDVSR